MFLHRMQIAETEWCEESYSCWTGGAKQKCCFTENKTPDCENNCFPSTAKVNLENGKSVRMSELQVGDKVQTGI